MRNLEIITKIEVYQYNELSGVQKKLVDKAKDTTKNAYCPYSKFSVGVAVMLANDEIIVGTNQENAAYPSGICAERTAMFYANSQFPHIAPTSMAIAAFHNGDFKEEAISPCGSCRQVLLETEIRFNKDIEIILYGKKEILIIKSIKDLLPLSFVAKSLTT